MIFGLNLPNYGSLGNRESMIAIAESAEEVGYSSLWTSDHIESGRGISVVNQSTNPGLHAERHLEVRLVTDLIDCSDRFGRHFWDRRAATAVPRSRHPATGDRTLFVDTE